ncbi:MAG: molybdenum cofactor biosynthesis protein [Cyanobacteria bacterium RYN_339]|nr:molybdenum cofactor biosynthesis protein [Cyanobacteria bacterium RYN_339]
MLDRFKRKVDYLRISVTDRCNLRCQYCMPATGMDWIDRDEILTYEEIERFVREVAVPLGIRKLRLTGGEPMVRKDLAGLIARLAVIPGIDDLALTTNGLFLEQQAQALKLAGLQRINVSMDSLRAERFKEITRGGDLERVWRGVDAAMAVGLTPLKLNVVVMAGFNEDELSDFVGLTLNRPYHVRFIEFMPVGEYELFKQVGYVSSQRMRELITYDLEPTEMTGNGPARYWQVPGALGTVGFISQMSHDFCSSCNRIRLTADGKVRHCLLSDHEIDVRGWLRGGTAPAEIQAALEADIQLKAENHEGALRLSGQSRTMSQIGG